MTVRQRGGALLEFAASLMVISTLFTGIFQFTYALSMYQELVHAIRSGARYASLRPQISESIELQKAVQNVVVYGDPKPSPGTKPIAAGLTPDHVALAIEPATVTVSLQGFTLSSLFFKIRLDGRPTVTFPRTTGELK